jgi:hypothetical protein
LDIRDTLSKVRTSIIKYNYSLDEETQDHVSYQGFMELTEDFRTLNITNRKPVDHTEYILEADRFKL